MCDALLSIFKNLFVLTAPIRARAHVPRDARQGERDVETALLVTKYSWQHSSVTLQKLQDL